MGTLGTQGPLCGEREKVGGEGNEGGGNEKIMEGG